MVEKVTGKAFSLPSTYSKETNAENVAASKARSLFLIDYKPHISPLAKKDLSFPVTISKPQGFPFEFNPNYAIGFVMRFKRTKNQ